jgi:hypothetical protein
VVIEDHTEQCRAGVDIDLIGPDFDALNQGGQ